MEKAEGEEALFGFGVSGSSQPAVLHNQKAGSLFQAVYLPDLPFPILEKEFPVSRQRVQFARTARQRLLSFK